MIPCVTVLFVGYYYLEALKFFLGGLISVSGFFGSLYELSGLFSYSA